MTNGRFPGNTHMVDSRLAELSQTIDAVDLGRRIRMARITAGMTQAQATGGEVTAAYLSRIEDGQRRPDAHLLERMAARMGTTLHQLLTGLTTHEARGLELQVEHAAITLALGDPEEAMQASTTAVGLLESYGDEALLASAKRVQAMAHRVAGEPSKAASILESLIAGSTPDVNTLRALIELCHCYRERDEFARAIAAAQRAERMIAELGIDGLAETLQLAAAVAAVHLRLGDLATATSVCRRALDAVAVDLPPKSQAELYWRASTSEATSNGATPAAIELAKVALTLVDLDDGRSSVEHVLAEVATAHGATSRPFIGHR